LDVNLFDTLAVTHAFPPPMRHRRAGRIATIIRSDRWEEPVSTDSTAASPPSTQGEDLDPRRWLAHLVDEVERHEAEEHVEKQVGELGEQQPTEDLPLDEQAQRLANPWAVVVAVRVRSTDGEHQERKGGRREREEECAPAKV
jgi:hypothetical protein